MPGEKKRPQPPKSSQKPPAAKEKPKAEGGSSTSSSSQTKNSFNLLGSLRRRPVGQPKPSPTSAPTESKVEEEPRGGDSSQTKKSLGIWKYLKQLVSRQSTSVGYRALSNSDTDQSEGDGSGEERQDTELVRFLPKDGDSEDEEQQERESKEDKKAVDRPRLNDIPRPSVQQREPSGTAKSLKKPSEQPTSRSTKSEKIETKEGAADALPSTIPLSSEILARAKALFKMVRGPFDLKNRRGIILGFGTIKGIFPSREYLVSTPIDPEDIDTVRKQVKKKVKQFNEQSKGKPITVDEEECYKNGVKKCCLAIENMPADLRQAFLQIQSTFVPSPSLSNMFTPDELSLLLEIPLRLNELSSFVAIAKRSGVGVGVDDIDISTFLSVQPKEPSKTAESLKNLSGHSISQSTRHEKIDTKEMSEVPGRAEALFERVRGPYYSQNRCVINLGFGTKKGGFPSHEYVVSAPIIAPEDVDTVVWQAGEQVRQFNKQSKGKYRLAVDEEECYVADGIKKHCLVIEDMPADLRQAFLYIQPKIPSPSLSDIFTPDKLSLLLEIPLMPNELSSFLTIAIRSGANAVSTNIVNILLEENAAINEAVWASLFSLPKREFEKMLQCLYSSPEELSTFLATMIVRSNDVVVKKLLEAKAVINDAVLDSLLSLPEAKFEKMFECLFKYMGDKFLSKTALPKIKKLLELEVVSGQENIKPNCLLFALMLFSSPDVRHKNIARQMASYAGCGFGRNNNKFQIVPLGREGDAKAVVSTSVSSSRGIAEAKEKQTAPPFAGRAIGGKQQAGAISSLSSSSPQEVQATTTVSSSIESEPEQIGTASPSIAS